MLPDGVSIKDAATVLRSTGLRGGLKSLYYSFKYCDSPTSIVLGNNVIAMFDRDINISINSTFLMSVTVPDVSHSKLRKSKLEIRNGGIFRVTAQEYARIGPGSVVFVEGDFSIGDSYINADSKIVCIDKIEIGDNCAIGWDVQLIDSNRHELRIDGNKTKETGEILIEDDVWIGHNVIIKKDVKIGKGAVVGSGSVVTKDIPAGCLAVGSPAKVIKEDIKWSH